MRTQTVTPLIFLLTFCTVVSRPCHSQDEASFRSGGKEIPLKIFPNLVVVEGVPAVARNREGTAFISGVTGLFTSQEEVPSQQELLQAQLTHLEKATSLVAIQTAENESSQVRTLLRENPGILDTGIVAMIEAPGLPAGREPVAVINSEFIVRFNENVPRERIDAINDENDVEIVRKSPYTVNEYILRTRDSNPELTISNANRYFEFGEVEFSHPNFIFLAETRQNIAHLPNDPLFSAQWHLHNTGQNGGTPDADVDAPEAWATTKGSPEVVIAVIDPHGVQTNHEDLISNRFVNRGEFGDDGNGLRKESNGVDDDGNGRADDVYGWNFYNDSNNPLRGAKLAHGTAAAGVALASGDNSKGVSGIAPGCRLLGICKGIGSADDAAAFRYAAAMGADVISNSWGFSIGTPLTDAVEAAITEVATQGRGGKGCVVLFAMTNEKLDNFGGPGGVTDISSHPNVMAIGRSTNSDLWGHSGFGARDRSRGDGMAFLAPTSAARGTAVSGCVPADLAGTLEITTTDNMGINGYNSGSGSCPCNPSLSQLSDANYTGCFGGTSSSTPLSAGIAALVLSINSSLRSDQVREILINSCDKIDKANAGYQPDHIGRDYSETHGYGRINAHRAVELARESLTTLSEATGAPPRTPNTPPVESLERLEKDPNWQAIDFGTTKAYVSEKLPWGVQVTPNAENAETVRSELATENPPSWTKLFDSSVIFLKDNSDVKVLNARVEEDGITKIGRPILIPLPDNQTTQAGIMLNEFSITAEPDTQQRQLDDVLSPLGYKVREREPLSQNRWTIVPVDKFEDPLAAFEKLKGKVTEEDEPGAIKSVGARYIQPDADLRKVEDSSPIRDVR